MTQPPARVAVTGGAGFLGSHFVRNWLAAGGGDLLTIDLLTYAGSLERLRDLEGDPRHAFLRADVADAGEVGRALGAFRPDVVVHFAAESHVTRSELTGDVFWRTNVEGTRVMLEAAAAAGARRFVHVSTDEVYGPILEGAFREEDKRPGDAQATSVYAKSKALADDLALAATAPAEVVVVRPTNCFGPYQHPEKAFPRWVTRALRGEPLLVWGDGQYVRQWLYSGDLAAAVALLVRAPGVGRVYNVGAAHSPEITNEQLARWTLHALGLPDSALVFTEYDRPDHDRRYAIDSSRIESLGWRRGDVWTQFAETLEWYRASRWWWEPLVAEAESVYRDDTART